MEMEMAMTMAMTMAMAKIFHSRGGGGWRAPLSLESNYRATFIFLYILMFS